MESLWLVPALPLVGFLILVLTEGRLSQTIVAVIGAGSVIGGNIWLTESVSTGTKVLLKRPELIYSNSK